MNLDSIKSKIGSFLRACLRKINPIRWLGYVRPEDVNPMVSSDGKVPETGMAVAWVDGWPPENTPYMIILSVKDTDNDEYVYAYLDYEEFTEEVNTYDDDLDQSFLPVIGKHGHYHEVKHLLLLKPN